jgi:DNA-binding MarR family transcriptional regulator
LSRNPLFESGWEDPGEKGEHLAIVQFPTFHIQRLAGYAKASVSRRYLEPFNLSLPEWRLLTLIAESSPVSFADITARTLMDKGQVSRTLRSLQGRSLVEVGPAVERKAAGRGAGVNPRVVVNLLPAGKALFEQILPVAREHQARLISLLSLEERRMFLQVVERLMNFLAEDSRKP